MVTFENNLAVPQKVINTEVSPNPETLLLDTYPRELKTHMHTKTCTSMFIAALFVTAKKVGIIQMSINWWMGK